MKAREFYIQSQNFDLDWTKAMVAERPRRDTIASDDIHVIEIRAYRDFVNETALTLQTILMELRSAESSAIQIDNAIGLIQEALEAIKGRYG